MATKYALQKIPYRPTTSFRSGPGLGYKYSDEDSVIAWFPLNDGLGASTPTTSPDQLEEKFKKIKLQYASAGVSPTVETESPSPFITSNSSNFDGTDVGTFTDTDRSFSFTDGTKDKPFSISFWINGTTLGSSGRTIMSKWNNSGAEEWAVEILSTRRIKVRLAGQANAGLYAQDFVADGQLTQDQWHHVVVAYDGIPVPGGHTHSISVYVDGVKQDRNSGTTSADYVAMHVTSLKVAIGGRGHGSANGIQAYLADVVFYSKQLNQESVLALYHAKNGVWIRSRNYDHRGSTIQIPEGVSVDGFREGVSIRNGEDLATSIRMKIHSTLNFIKAHSGSAVSSDGPFDDSDIPISPPIPGATSRITVAGGAINVGTKINIISTDLTEKTYIGVAEDHATITNGSVLTAGTIFTPNVDTITEGDPRIGMVAFMVGSSAADAANMLEIAINHVNGHNGASRGKKIIIKNNGAGRLDLTQARQGEAGNTTITVTGDNSDRITVLNNGFTGGNNDVASRFTGILNSSRGKSGYTSLLLHEIEKRDFGTLNRYQDGTPFNDNVFDSPQKILDDVRTTSGSPQDRHLRVYIGETPNELYRPTDVYQKEARIDVFDRHIDFESTIPDIRDAEKDFTMRSRRLTRSGSWTLASRNRGFSAECNCIHLNDMRYNDARETSIPFYEFYNDGDISEPKVVKKHTTYNLASNWYSNYRHENSNTYYGLADNVLAYWKLDKINADGTVTDEKGRLNAAQIKDGSDFAIIDVGDTPSKKMQENSIIFRSSNDNAFRVNDPSDICLPVKDGGHAPMSISVWAKTDAGGSKKVIVSKESNTDTSWLLYTSSDNITFEISDDGDLSQNENGDMISVLVDHPGGGVAWCHICVVYDGSGDADGINIYINGVLGSGRNSFGRTSLAQVPPKLGAPITIGGSFDNASDNIIYPWYSNLANLAIFNKKLEVSEIKTIIDAANYDAFEISTDANHLKGSSFTHLGRGRMETILSQSSGPRTQDSVNPGKTEPYGVYMQSTVNTFYGIVDGDSPLHGKTFTARHRVASADRPFHDTSKEDLVPTLINTSNDADFITEVKTLYMTGASVHEGGDTGYNLSTTGFQGDLGLHKRDSLVFSGLKRGQ